VICKSIMLDRDQIACYNNLMTNKTAPRSLSDLVINAPATWIWQDDMIVFQDDKSFKAYADAWVDAWADDMSDD
jgi:hypothetical protein